jgi:Holliday junction resolvase RusA-like endonuclease
MNQLRFVVNGPPVPYQRVVPRAGGRSYQPENAKAYQGHVATVARAAAHNAKWQRPGKHSPLVLRVEVFRVRRVGDLSNFVKIVEDGINDAEMVWQDDRLVEAIVARMHVDKEHPRVEVTLGFLPER